MASVAYNIFKEKMLTAGINMTAADIRCLLLIGSTTTPDNPDHDFVADIVADEASDASYARVAAAGKTVTRNDASDRAEFDCNDITFTALAGGMVEACVFFVQVTNDADSWLITLHDFADAAPDGSDFTLTVGANGLIHVF